MLRKIRERMESERGFTLIELLVVILIIGILAAIAIPAFLGQREKASDSEAKSMVRNAASAAGAYYTDNQSFEGMDFDALDAIEPSLDAEILTAVTPADGNQGYTLTATADSTGHTFTITRADDGSTTRSCTGEGGCNNNSW